MNRVSVHNKAEIIYYQKKWLKTLEDISIKPIYLANTWNHGTPGKRFPSKNYHWIRPYEYRENLHNELPYDLDVPDYDLLKLLVQPMLDFLDSEHIPYIKSGSGGSKSVHVQIWFEPTLACALYSWRSIRLGLWDWILDGAGIPPDMRGDGKRPDGVNYPYDRSVANFGDMVSARVMRDFGGHGKRYTKTVIEGELPETREDIYGEKVVFPSEIKLWNPRRAISELDDLRLKAPSSCLDCPVEMEWLLRHNQEEGLRQYPRLCRDCGKIYEVSFR